MHIHEEVLKVANEIASGRNDWTFGVEEAVRQLRHLNESSVRTHVVSRCCINAPKNHPHKWDYFRRVGRGRYQILPAHRKATDAAQATARKSAARVTQHPTTSRPGSTSRRETIHAVLQKDGTTYVAECLELAVVTQGNTLDEVFDNLKQALALHLEGEDLATLGLVDHPRLQLVYDVPLAS
jgi:predicted RNase H-like HicB family nuclease